MPSLVWTLENGTTLPISETDAAVLAELIECWLFDLETYIEVTNERTESTGK